MQYVQWRLPRRPIEGAPQGLAVDRHHILQGVGEAMHEAGKAGGECHRIEQLENPAEGVMAGNAMLKGQKPPKERLLCLAEQRQ
jgi:hypothetical protein